MCRPQTNQNSGVQPQGIKKNPPAHHKTVGSDLPNIVMKMEKQDVAIKLAFYNGNTMVEETELLYDIDRKIPNLVKPRNEALVHTSKYLLEAYATES